MNPNRRPAASLLPDPVLRPEESIVLEVLRADESLQIDELLEKLETQLTSSEVFTALFELEMSGRIRCLPGKNYVRNPCDELLRSSCCTDFAQNVPIRAGCDELHISETLRVQLRSDPALEKRRLASGNEDAFHVSLQILQPIFRSGRQARRSESSTRVKTTAPSGHRNETETGLVRVQQAGWSTVIRNQGWQ